MRKKAREIAFKSIYQNLFIDLSQDELGQIFEDEKLEEDDDKFVFEIISNFKQNREELTKKIEENLKGYEISRVYKIDLALLYLALVEVDYIKTPNSVVINEVVELAKTYSTEKSPKFLNGVLSTLIG